MGGFKGGDYMGHFRGDYMGTISHSLPERCNEKLYYTLRNNFDFVGTFDRKLGHSCDLPLTDIILCFASDCSNIVRGTGQACLYMWLEHKRDHSLTQRFTVVNERFLLVVHRLLCVV